MTKRDIARYLGVDVQTLRNSLKIYLALKPSLGVKIIDEKEYERLKNESSAESDDIIISSPFD
ncbi:hypothetical protein [Campylobacter devanensis]|uniref:hypothetical protein n=1 Tax=Campylobacter devanensis TaxID=3161138 RepID=UPI00112FB128|nr:hypothetical protein [Campylobacter sp. P0088]